MKAKSYLYSMVVLFLLFEIIVALPADAVIKIMPLGDSITQGFSSGVSEPENMVSYRFALRSLLDAAGYDVDYVGSLDNGSAIFGDSQHEGHGGWTADEIVNGRPGEGNLGEWLTAEAPGIVLLHIGTNDISSSRNPMDIVSEVNDILDRIYLYDPGITVILALIINRMDYDCATGSTSDTTTFNNLVNDMALVRIEQGDRIEVIDMECGAGMDYRQEPVGDMYNQLHPFETGYEKMADVWFSAFQAIQPTAVAGSNQSVNEFDLVTLDGSNSFDHFGDAVSYRWEQKSGTAVALSDNQAAMPTFTAPDVGSSGDTLTFQLTVTDYSGLEANDTTKIDISLIDNCPDDPGKTEPGICGCGVADTDSDSDGTPDCNDNCPNDPDKIELGICGCGISDIDSDGDGTVDCIDNCPNDPEKTGSGICGCGISDIDSDGDNTSDCIDNCPNDPGKTEPGICGCGVADTDSDSDGTPDCNDNCSNDPNKTQPGICGCGISDSDSDGDGKLDCVDTNDDNHGLPDGEEQGPDGNNLNYDGNDDGIADSLQDNVASFHTFDGQNYITIESPVGTSISNCTPEDNPSKTNAPSDVDFSYGFIGFRIDGIGIGSVTQVALYLPAGETVDTYYKYGPTPNNTANHWYKFLYDGQTGAEINGNVIILHFIDGKRGDDDPTANGIIVDIGAPSITVKTSGEGTTVASEGGGGGGGCFIETAAYGSLMGPHIKVLHDFRDRFLQDNGFANAFVNFYDKHSAPISEFIAKHSILRFLVRICLLPLVGLSWASSELGFLSTIALIFFFGLCLFGAIVFKSRL